MTDQTTGSGGHKKHDDGISVARDASIPIEVVVDVIKNLCLAYSTIHLYSYDHPITETQIKQAWDHLKGVIAEHGKITLSMADGKLFFEGIALEEKNPTVARLSEHFEQLQVTSLTFVTELKEDEFHQFFEIFVKEPAEIKNAGGLEAVFEQKEITNIRLNSAVYRLIHEDEKVVSSDSVVMDRDQSSPSRSRRLRKKADVADEIVRYFSAELLKQSKDSSSLINAMKNDPVGLAEKVSRLILSADSDLEKVEFEEMMTALTENIDATAQVIAATEDGTDDPAELNKLDKALHSMQGEMQRRAKRIASTGATKFLRRMTDLIAAYSDSARAESAMRDFVEEEQTQRAAEQMLSEISPDAEASRQLMETIRDTMAERDWDPLELARQIERLAQGDVRPRRNEPEDLGEMSRERRRRLAASIKHKVPKHVLVSLLMRGMHGGGNRGGAMLQQRWHEVESELQQKEEQIANLQQRLAQKDHDADKLQKQITDLQKQVEKLKSDRVRLGHDYLALQQKLSQSDREWKEQLAATEKRLEDQEKEFEERLDDEVGTAMGMLDESENVRLRLEHLVEKLDTGVVVVDREGRVVTSMNADDFPYLQTAAIPPADLVRALQNYDGNSILTYDKIQVFGVVRDDEGYLSGFMFLPESEMDADQRPRTSAVDVLASLDDDDEDEETLDDLLAHRETPSAVLKRIEKDKGTVAPGASESPNEEQQESLEDLLSSRQVPSSRRKTAEFKSAAASEPAPAEPPEPESDPPPLKRKEPASEKKTLTIKKKSEDDVPDDAQKTTILKKREP